MAKDPPDAHLVKAILEQCEIACEVRGEQLWNARGELPLTSDSLPTVWISDDNKYEEAARLVTAYENGTLAENAGEPWKCPDCGEEIEGQFTDCWQCGASRPSETQLES